jgi:serine/threonine protein kinase
MQETFHQYHLRATLATKFSHTTYLASPFNEPKHQVILVVFTPSLLHKDNGLLVKAQMLNKLEHQHLLPILDVGIEKEQFFLVRDYLPNGSLRDRLKESPQGLALEKALSIILQIGKALLYAHQHGCFHGSIKPENILFGAYGQAVLTDFTLVSTTETIIRDQIIDEHAFCYMAPEQFTGPWDAQSDQYALGCLTYELLTGKVPFVAQTLVSIKKQHKHAQPDSLSKWISDLPPSLETAVLKTLAKDPNDRFFDCKLFLEVIQSFVLSSPTFPFQQSRTSHKSTSNAHLEQTVNAGSPVPPTRTVSFSGRNEERLNGLLHRARGNSDSPVPYKFLTQPEDALPDTPQTSKHNGDDGWLTSLFAEQERHDPSASPVLVDELDEPTLIWSDDLEPAPFQKRSKRHRKRNSMTLMLLSFASIILALAALGSHTSFSPLRTDKSDISSVPTRVVMQVGIATTTGISLQQVINATPRETGQSVQQSISALQTHTIPSQTNLTPQSTPQAMLNPTPTPTPILTPTPKPLQTTIIDDSVQGSGTNQFNYVGGWGHNSNYCKANPCEYNNGNSWDNTTNDYVTLSFVGVQIKFYGVIDTVGGIGAISIDGGSETMLDYYSASRMGNQLLWTSSTMPEGTHTLKLRVTGNKDSSATNVFIDADRVDILS